MFIEHKSHARNCSEFFTESEEVVTCYHTRARLKLAGRLSIYGLSFMYKTANICA